MLTVTPPTRGFYGEFALVVRSRIWGSDGVLPDADLPHGGRGLAETVGIKIVARCCGAGCCRLCCSAKHIQRAQMHCGFAYVPPLRLTLSLLRCICAYPLVICDALQLF